MFTPLRCHAFIVHSKHSFLQNYMGKEKKCLPETTNTNTIICSFLEHSLKTQPVKHLCKGNPGSVHSKVYLFITLYSIPHLYGSCI